MDYHGPGCGSRIAIRPWCFANLTVALAATVSSCDILTASTAPFSLMSMTASDKFSQELAAVANDGMELCGTRRKMRERQKERQNLGGKKRRVNQRNR
jgi:hypothetical protein